jgi:ADP-heptose:LPS heptosyltransferase
MPYEFHCLHKDISEQDMTILQKHPHVTIYASEFINFDETAALMSFMDLIISVDTSVAHLAGALGLRAWILIQHVPDFRWHLDQEDSPWYSSVTLLRQDEKMSWDSVVDDVIKKLESTFLPPSRQRG